MVEIKRYKCEQKVDAGVGVSKSKGKIPTPYK